MRRHRLSLWLVLLACTLLSYSFAVPTALHERNFLVVVKYLEPGQGVWIYGLDPPGAYPPTCVNGPPTTSSSKRWAKHISSTLDARSDYSSWYVRPVGIGGLLTGHQITVKNDSNQAFWLYAGPGTNCPSPPNSDLMLVDNTDARPLAGGVTIIEMARPVR